MTAPLSPEGRLTIDLTRAGGRLTARITSDRPAGIGRAFAGRDPRDVLGMIPHIFTLCGVAHTVAAVEAYEEAHGIAASSATRAARRTAVAVESAREHLLRIALDWPRFLGEEPARALLPQIMALLPMARRALAAGGDPFQPGVEVKVDTAAVEEAIAALDEHLHAAVFGEPAGAWLARRSAGELAEWSAHKTTVAARFVQLIAERGWQSLGAADTRFLHNPAREEMAAVLDGAEDFVAAPLWDGEPRETTPLARQKQAPPVAALMVEHGSGLVARAAARLAELAGLPEELRKSTAPAEAAEHAADGSGLAQIEAARGRLIHYLRLDGGRVDCYTILAPTDWNFHPRGPAVKALESLEFHDACALREAADMVLNLIDPCVACELRLH